jgi:hypothetical protein
MKPWLLSLLFACLCTMGCSSMKHSSEAQKAIAIQKDTLHNEILRYEQLCIENEVRLMVLDRQIASLDQRIETITQRVHLLLDIERSNVCLNILPEDLSRSEEIRQTHDRWQEALQAPEAVALSAQEIAILERQFLQAVQRAIVTESTQIQTLMHEMDAKDRQAAALRTQRLDFDRRILALAAALSALEE